MSEQSYLQGERGYDFLDGGAASDWFYSFANDARPNETKTEGCANVPEACDILLETYDYEEACDLSLRDVSTKVAKTLAHRHLQTGEVVRRHQPSTRPTFANV